MSTLHFWYHWIFKDRIFPAVLKFNRQIYHHHNPIWILLLLYMNNCFSYLKVSPGTKMKKPFSWSPINPLHLFIVIEKFFLWISPNLTITWIFQPRTKTKIYWVLAPIWVKYLTQELFLKQFGYLFGYLKIIVKLWPCIFSFSFIYTLRKFLKSLDRDVIIVSCHPCTWVMLR